MREILVSELVKEVLGPRDGLREVMTENPIGEYVTGVLAPISQHPEPEPEAESELDAEGGGQEREDDAQDSDVNAPPVFAPVLDPKSRPHSIGLSFVVKNRERDPELDVCLTWARYIERDGAWHREPRHFVGHFTSAATCWIDSTGKQVLSPDEAEVSLHLLLRPGPKSKTFLITIYLVNRTRVAEDSHPDATHHVFQPQIRATCAPGTKVVAGLEGRPHTNEDRLLQMLYREHPVLARGHICSAVWSSIDPESAYKAAKTEVLSTSPLLWTDGALLDDKNRAPFSPPDVRTEYVPVAAIQAPDLDWPAAYGTAPELEARVLAETWRPSDLKSKLSPIVDGYRKWIEDRHKERNGGTIQADQKEIADGLIEYAENAAIRIERIESHAGHFRIWQGSPAPLTPFNMLRAPGIVPFDQVSNIRLGVTLPPTHKPALKRDDPHMWSP